MLPEDHYKREWIVGDNLAAQIVDEADRLEPLVDDALFDPDNIDEIDEKLEAFERAQQQRAEEELRSDEDS